MAAVATASDTASTAAPADPSRVPLLPLADQVHFPRTDLILEGAVPAHEALIEELFRQPVERRWLGTVLLKPVAEKGFGQAPEVFSQGTAGRVLELRRLPSNPSEPVSPSFTSSAARSLPKTVDLRPFTPSLLASRSPAPSAGPDGREPGGPALEGLFVPSTAPATPGPAGSPAPAGPRWLLRIRGEFRFFIERELPDLTRPWREARIHRSAEPEVPDRDPGVTAVRREILHLCRSLAWEMGRRFPLSEEEVEHLASLDRFERLVNGVAARLDLPPLRKLTLLEEHLLDRGVEVLGILRSRQRLLDLLRPWRPLSTHPERN